MRYLIKRDIGCVYWLEGETLCVTPLCIDETFDTEDGGAVDEEMIGDEIVKEDAPEPITFSQLYPTIKAILKK